MTTGPAAPGQRAGRRAGAHIGVTVAYTTLLGLDDQPAHLAGYGPITAATARRIAAQGTWRRLLTDPATGTLRDYGATTYRPPADLERFVLARDRRCIFPHCGMPAHRCQLDHRIPHPQGPTREDNLAPLCDRHHNAKTHAGWRYHPHPDGGYTWTSPAGKSYHVPAVKQLDDP